jgi:hypothetical protein
LKEELCLGISPMKRLPSPFLFEDGKQRENLLGRLLCEESCFGNESFVLPRPNIPLLVFGRFFRGTSSPVNISASVHEESMLVSLECDMNKTSLPVSPTKIALTKGFIMLAAHVLFVQPGLNGPGQPVQPELAGQSLESQEMGL